MSWIPTYCGVKFDLLNPLAVDVRPHDISFALSNFPRFTGHTAYTVAQHSVMVADLVPPELAVFGLLHDAAEAYVGDVSRPLKALLGETYREIEKHVQAAIDERFGLEWTDEIAWIVKRADDIALATERRDLFFEPPPFDRKLPPAAGNRLIVWNAQKSRSLFEERLAPLVNRR